MPFYFFKTSLENRNGKTDTPTLRALPGQTFPDGTFVDFSMNVQAPKEAGSHPGGAREDYPIGTIFCSTHLEKTSTGNTNYYTVYRNKTVPGFHPVLKAGENYAKPEHKDTKMEAAWALFSAGISPNTDKTEAEQEPTETGNTQAVYTPCDANGNANSADPNWKERYSNQIEDESGMFRKWMTGMFSAKNVKLATRISMDSARPLLEELYKTGETIDTLASRKRLEKFLEDNKISYNNFSVLKDPHKRYLEWVKKEHDNRAHCTATDRDPKSPEDMNDAMSIIQEARTNITGLSEGAPSADDYRNIAAAIEAGWTLDDLINPENITKAETLSDYGNKLVSGAIPLPEKFTANGASLIETLLNDKKNRKPKDKDGFHVDDLTWKVLLDNFHQKKNTLLTGPSGSGKTEIVKLLSKRMGVQLTIIQGGAITDPTEQLVGKMDFDPSTGGTVFDWADFAKAVQKPGIVLIDEINRTPKNGENLLFSCLDLTRTLPAYAAKGSDRRQIPVHPECVFFATANIGDEYTGTKQIDAALMTRFECKLEMEYMPMNTEKKLLTIITGIKDTDAENIAMVASQIRLKAAKTELQATVSTRETIAAARYVKDGFTVLEAMTVVFLPLFDKGCGSDDVSSERTQVRNIISQRLNNKKTA